MARLGLPDLALGSYEAACVMGLHFTQPARMAAAGRLLSKPLAAAWTDSQERLTQVYSLHDCDDDFQAYASHGDDVPHRARGYVHLRVPMLKRLADAHPRILFDDAIGTGDVAALLCVHPTAVQKLVERGSLHPRRPANDRNPCARVFIFSRAECLADRQKVAALERAGRKPGPRRRVAQ